MDFSNNPVVLTCPTCNAPLDFDGTHTIVQCQFCGNNSVIPATLVNQRSELPSEWDEICKLVNSGSLDVAVTKFKASYDVNDREANEAISAIANGRLVTPSMVDKQSASELVEAMQKVQRLVSTGNNNEAAELYHETFKIDKDQIDGIINQIADWSSSQNSIPFVENRTENKLISTKENGMGGSNSHHRDCCCGCFDLLYGSRNFRAIQFNARRCIYTFF